MIGKLHIHTRKSSRLSNSSQISYQSNIQNKNSKFLHEKKKKPTITPFIEFMNNEKKEKNKKVDDYYVKRDKKQKAKLNFKKIKNVIFKRVLFKKLVRKNVENENVVCLKKDSKLLKNLQTLTNNYVEKIKNKDLLNDNFPSKYYFNKNPIKKISLKGFTLSREVEPCKTSIYKIR